ncbi:hypothetical protein [Herbaspirillum sp. NPDC087042]|uniref:hypothetical protein n=1 Tax=Herbaspirillum sp. NPDC087042 TaxID=3364004 RepID=UPI003815D654
MAGRVFFRAGQRHSSRSGHKTGLSGLREELSRFFLRPISEVDLDILVDALAIANMENSAQTGHDRPNRKDALAQLKAMTRTKDDDKLIHALRGCDRMTFEAIQWCHAEIINEIVLQAHHFVDVHGHIHQFAPQIELYGEHHKQSNILPYLPMGIAGIRKAINFALQSIDSDTPLPGATHLPSFRIHPTSQAGNLKKTYQTKLAMTCVSMWAGYGRPDQRKPWQSPGTGNQSAIVNFTGMIFSFAGMHLSHSRLVTLLRGARIERSQELRDRRNARKGISK